MVSAASSSCGTGLFARGSCKAAEGILSGLGHAVVNVVLWPLRAFVTPGQVPTASQLVALVLVVALVVGVRAWRLRTPLGEDLRGAVGRVAGRAAPYPRLAAYLRDFGRGAVLVAAYAAGWAVWAVARRRGRVGRLVALALVLYIALGIIGRWFGWVPGVLFVPAAVHAVASLGRRPAPSTDWWSERVLLAALLESGIIARARVGQPPTALSRLGRPHHDAVGTAIKIALPGAATYSAVQRSREQLAAALRVPVAALTVTADPQDAANVVALHVRLAGAPLPAPPDDGARAVERWADPLRIGTDRQGRPVMAATRGLHTLLAGATGGGKTVAARRFVARAMLDPAVPMLMLDGKGSGADWAGLLPLLAAPPVQIGQADLGQRAVELLRRILDDNRQHDGQRHRATPPGCLLIVEEWGAFRSAVAAGVERRDLDEAMRTLLQLGRSAGTHVLMITQRPTMTSLPTDQSANVMQRIVLPCANDEEASYGLGQTPIVARLTQAGAALMVSPHVAQTAVQVDNLDDTAWEALCARAAVLRGRTGGPVVDMVKALPVAIPEVVVPAGPLLDAVAELLAVEPEGLPTKLLRSLLPADLRTASEATLGKALTGRPDLFGKAWRAAKDGTPRHRVWRILSPIVPDPSRFGARAVPDRSPSLPVAPRAVPDPSRFGPRADDGRARAE